MKLSLKVLMTLIIATVLIAAFAIAASARNWYAAETVDGVDKLYITAADEKPDDGKSWSDTVPEKYNGALKKSWIYISSNFFNPVEIIIDGDVVCPDGDTLNFGICGGSYLSSGSDYDNSNVNVPVTITGADDDSSLTINLTGTRSDIGFSGAIMFWQNGNNDLTISNLTLSLASADVIYTSAGIRSEKGLKLSNVVIEKIDAGYQSDLERQYSIAINSNGYLTIEDSKIYNVTVNNAYYGGAGICGSDSNEHNSFVKIKNSIIKMNLTVPNISVPNIRGLLTSNLILEIDPDAKYPLDIEITADEKAVDCSTIDAGTLAMLDSGPFVMLAGQDAETATTYDTAENFNEALKSAKYMHIYVNKVDEPVITEADVNQQSKKRITIECETEGAQIYYRLDGGVIESPSDGMLYTGPFEVGKNAVITACGFADGYVKSLTATLEVTVRVATPVITETAVGQQGKKLITITCATEGAQIYYRLDGGDVASPADGMLYTGPFEVGEDVAVTARGFAEGKERSDLATLDVESNYDFIVGVMQYMSLIVNQPIYGVSVTGNIKVTVK